MSEQTQPGTAPQSLAEKLRTDAIAIFGEGQAERDIIEWFYGALLAAAPAPVVPEVPALWSKSLGFCWAADADYPGGDWIVGTVDEDGNRYDVLRVEASQYDAEGESQKIAEAIVKLWAWAAHPAERQEQGEVQGLSAWIACCDDQLPPEDQQVLCWCDDGGMTFIEVASQHNGFFTDCFHELLPVTHWMPFPAAPALAAGTGQEVGK